MWHGPFRAIEKCGDHVVQLKIDGTPYILFSVVHLSKLKLVIMFPDRPTERLSVEVIDCIDFDDAFLPEDSWTGDPFEGEIEVEKISDLRLG